MSDNMNSLSDFERSTIGELGNVAMGSGATTLSMVLNKPVVITAPEVSETSLDAMTGELVAPMVIVEVKYTIGLEHSNVFLLTPQDTAIICDLMMGGDGTAPSPEIGEMQLSAIGEAMNQMMGTAATAMSQFFSRRVDISPPTINFVVLSNAESVQAALANVPLTQIAFQLTVEGLVDSKLIQVLPTASVKKLVEDLILAADNPEAVAAQVAADEEARRKAEAARANPEPQQEQQPIVASVPQAEVAPSMVAASQVAPSLVAAGMESAIPRSMVADMPPAAQPQYPPQYQEAAHMAPPGYPQQGYGQVPPGYAPPGYGQQQLPPGYPPGYGQMPGQMPPGYGHPGQPSPFQADPVSVRQAQFPSLNAPGGMEALSGLDLIMDVPLKVTVELGRTRMQIRDVLDLGKGAVVELDKLVGEPIDMLVNGKLIAKGEVVVIDENFGIRVTDIVSPIERFNSLKIQ